jgi:hypothetical protein
MEEVHMDLCKLPADWKQRLPSAKVVILKPTTSTKWTKEQLDILEPPPTAAATAAAAFVEELRIDWSEHHRHLADATAQVILLDEEDDATSAVGSQWWSLKLLATHEGLKAKLKALSLSYVYGIDVMAHIHGLQALVTLDATVQITDNLDHTLPALPASLKTLKLRLLTRDAPTLKIDALAGCPDIQVLSIEAIHNTTLKLLECSAALSALKKMERLCLDCGLDLDAAEIWAVLCSMPDLEQLHLSKLYIDSRCTTPLAKVKELEVGFRLTAKDNNFESMLPNLLVYRSGVSSGICDVPRHANIRMMCVPRSTSVDTIYDNPPKHPALEQVTIARRSALAEELARSIDAPRETFLCEMLAWRSVVMPNVREVHIMRFTCGAELFMLSTFFPNIRRVRTTGGDDTSPLVLSDLDSMYECSDARVSKWADRYGDLGKCILKHPSLASSWRLPNRRGCAEMYVTTSNGCLIGPLSVWVR